MKAEITKLSEFIQSLEVIKSFGGLCVNMIEKDMPYGIDEKGRTYTTDEYLGTLGYLYIHDIKDNQKHGFNVTVGLNLFVSPKSVGELLPVYQLPMFVFTKLKERYKDISFEARIDTRKYSHYEMTTIKIMMPVYSPCDEIELKAAIC
jgi:hypothetical protein